MAQLDGGRDAIGKAGDNSYSHGGEQQPGPDHSYRDCAGTTDYAAERA
jgi:hypothetical protein